MVVLQSSSHNAVYANKKIKKIKEILPKLGNPLQFELVNIIEGFYLSSLTKGGSINKKLVKIVKNFNKQDKE